MILLRYSYYWFLFVSIVLEICQKESNSCNLAVAALTSELLVNIAVSAIKNGM